ncbi:MAG: UDP-N-acetylmuramate dehydrogenase [Candidatus Saccharibacteria bacterium]
MEIKTNIPLKDYTTMRIGGNARFMAEILTPTDVATICKNAKSQNLPIFVIGGGSNLIAHDEGFNGIIIHIGIPGFEIIYDDDNSTIVKIGAGENWDSVVKQTVDMSLTGIEAMSGIPGTTGAAPIQNIGAYGQEIANTLQSLEAYDTQTDQFITLQNTDCKFAYRHSIFRGESIGRYIVTYINLKLSKSRPTAPFYDSLQKYLDTNSITSYDPQIIRNAVLKIRESKLPDPNILANSGSFFKNAIVSQKQLDELRAIDPDAPSFAMPDGNYKIPTGWLIENAGLKGKIFHGMRIYDKNALVLVNESANSYGDLAAARDEITKKIYDEFDIQIEQEPLEIV